MISNVIKTLLKCNFFISSCYLEYTCQVISLSKRTLSKEQSSKHPNQRFLNVAYPRKVEEAFSLMATPLVFRFSSRGSRERRLEVQVVECDDKGINVRP